MSHVRLMMVTTGLKHSQYICIRRCPMLYTQHSCSPQQHQHLRTMGNSVMVVVSKRDIIPKKDDLDWTPERKNFLTDAYPFWSAFTVVGVFEDLC